MLDSTQMIAFRNELFCASDPTTLATVTTTGKFPAPDPAIRQRVVVISPGDTVGICQVVRRLVHGQFSGAFPSGHGTQGGDFSATFTILR